MHVVLELGNGDSSSDSSDSDYVQSNEFSESSDEEFTIASDADDFVMETHNIVEDWNNWEPKSSQEKRFKRVVDAIEHREMRKADERSFLRGKAAPNYKNPKKRRKC